MKFIIELSMVMFLVSIFTYAALAIFFSSDTSSFDNQTLVVWVAVPAVTLLGIVIFLLNKARSDGNAGE